MSDITKKKDDRFDKVDEIIQRVETGDTAVSMVKHKTSNKSKVTYYISDDAINAIDKIYFTLRQAVAGNKTKINKSLIVEKALMLTLDEIESNELENSELYKRIITEI